MISTVEKVLFLKSVDLFSKIPGEDLAQVAGIAQEVTFDNGQLIIQEGEIGDSMFLIIEGEIIVHRAGQQLTRLGEREAFGEMAILDNEPRSATVVALSHSRLLTLDGASLKDLILHMPEISFEIFRVLTGRIRRAEARQSEQRA